jgi:hypothetical protein
MTRRRRTRNPVRVRAVQFSSRLVGTYGCGQVRHDSGRVRPARFLAGRRPTAQIGPENSAGCGSGSMFGSECHALLPCYNIVTIKTITMSSNSQSQQTNMTPASPAQDHTNMIETFVKELVVDRDFKLDESSNIVMIRHLHVSNVQCTYYVESVFGSRCLVTRTRVKNAQWDS